MNATKLTTDDIHRAADDDRWAGYGYLGERRNHFAGANERGLSPQLADAEITVADQIVIAHANAQGWTYEDLFAWANSKNGRYFADEIFGGMGQLADRLARVERFQLLALPAVMA